MRKFVRKKKIGLGLGGGAVLGAAHIGVLKALEENEIPINYIAGTSIGAFVAAFYLAMIATDIASGKKVVLQEGKVAKAAMASTCIPGIFIPVEIDDTLLVDGGIVENVPITPLQEMGAEFIIAVDLNARRSHKKPENIIEVLMNAFDFTMMTATKLQSQEADLIIKPDLSGFNMIDTEQTPDLIERGYDEAIKMLKKL